MLVAVIAALSIFYFFPDFLVKIFSGKVVPEASKVLFYVGIAIGLVSVTNLILLYKLSMGKTRRYQYLILFVIIEVVLLSSFSSNLVQFSIAFITAAATFLFGAVVLLGED